MIDGSLMLFCYRNRWSNIVVKTKELSVDLCQGIVNAQNDTIGYKRVSKLVHLPVTTIRAINNLTVNKYQYRGTIIFHVAIIVW